jgi:hypothetical protein
MLVRKKREENGDSQRAEPRHVETSQDEGSRHTNSRVARQVEEVDGGLRAHPEEPDDSQDEVVKAVRPGNVVELGDAGRAKRWVGQVGAGFEESFDPRQHGRRVASVREGDRNVSRPQPHEPRNDAERQDGGGQVQGHIGEQLGLAKVPETLDHQIQAPTSTVARFRSLDTAAPLPTLKLYRPWPCRYRRTRRSRPGSAAKLSRRTRPGAGRICDLLLRLWDRPGRDEGGDRNWTRPPSVVKPQATRTRRAVSLMLGRQGADIAFLASDEAGYITGQVLGVDGGLAMM